MTFRYDFHVHSSPLSACARNTPEEMCRAAVESELTGIALTEHNVFWSPQALKELRDEFPELTVLAGVEVSWVDHHFLVFGPGDDEVEFSLDWSVPKLADRVHSQGGIIIWAHPFRFHRDVPAWLDEAELDGIEVDSSHMNARISAKAESIAARKGLRTFCNSDAHDVHTLGPHFNTLPWPLQTTEDLIGAMKKRGWDEQVCSRDGHS